MRSPRSTLLALSGSDVPDGQHLLVYSCEDCACPVSHTDLEQHDVLDPRTCGPLVRARDTVAVDLDGEHVALFGPFGNGGVVVVNHSARDLLDELQVPTELAEIVEAGFDREQATDVLERLLAADLVHPPGVMPAQRFRESRELTVWLHVTNACNLACPYCYVAKSRESMDAATAQDTIDAIVRSAITHGFRSIRLKYAGGEATLNKQVVLAVHERAEKLCEQAGLGLSAVLLSNGVAISEEFAATLAAHRVSVMISLDGIGAAHDAQRPTLGGQASFDKVARSIDRLRTAGAPPHLSITITGRNVADIAPVVRFALERELTFSFNLFRDNSCASGADGLNFEQEAMIEGLRAAFAVIEETLPPWSVIGSILDRGQLLTPRQKSCGVGDDYVVIDQHGHIAQCHMDLSATLGDVRHVDPVSAIRANSAPIKNLLVEDKVGCRDCTWQNWCSGGCSVATFLATGRYDVRSPNCGIYTTIYPEAVRLEGLRLLRYARREPHSELAVGVP